MNELMLKVAIAGLIVCLAACHHTASETRSRSDLDVHAGELRILRSWTGMQSPVSEASCTLISDREAWMREWSRAGQAASELPPIDFANESVITVFHGADRAHHSMQATLTRDGDEWLLAYELFSTSGRRSPEVAPFGFYVVPRFDAAVRIESHHVHGPSQPIVSVLGTVGLGSR